MDLNDSPLPSPRWPTRNDTLLISIALMILMVLALKNAWISDDAMITFRTVLNAANGYGFTWNVDERVQAYTHPLWMLLLTGAYLVTHEIFFTCAALSLLCVAGTFLLISLGAARNQAGLLAASATLILAKSFIDFSTSGLENPLSHLLLAAFCVSYLHANPKHLWLTALCCGLLAINRMDLLVLAAPALAIAGLSPNWPAVQADCAAARGLPGRLRALLGVARPRPLAALAVGMIPLLAWEIFSLIYYGFLLPNTAYAKLNTGIAQGELYRQGLIYLLNSARNDPVTLIAIGVGSLAPLFSRRWRSLALSLGIWLYLIYVLRIGGDFMSGRFLTAPLTVAATLIAAELRATPGYVLACVLAALGMLNPQGSLAILISDDPASSSAEIKTDAQILQGVVDERAFYFTRRSLAALGRDPLASDDPYLHAGRRGSSQVVSVLSIIGMYGLTVGPDTHIVDNLALSDPLLARLPASYTPIWRIGHFGRAIPDGYIETLERGVNLIRDPDLAAYYDKLHLITSGPLLSGERWSAIWGMLTGAYNHLIDVDHYRYPEQQKLVYTAISSRSSQQETHRIPVSGALIDFDQPQSSSRLEFTFTQDQRLRMQFLQDTRVVYQADLVSPVNPLRALDLQTITLPPSVTSYDQIRLLPLEKGDLAFGYLHLLGPDDQPAPQIRLGSGWYPPFKIPDLQVLGPASIFVTASQQQPYWLDLTPSMIYEPDAESGRGTHGTLIVQTSAGYTTTVTLEAEKPLSLRLDLPAGPQRIDLSLAAGSTQPLHVVGNFDQDVSFALSAIHLATLDEIAPLPEDLLINGQAQRAEPAQLIALFGDGWYRYEDAANVRWAGPDARIDIYSPIAQSAQIKLALRYISDGNGPSDGGILTVTANGQAAAPAEAWTWQPFVAPVTLQPGWNTLDLSLAAPAFQEPVADPARTEPRMLSFGVERIEILPEK
ncbi:MAG: hypothetical protein HGA65_00645 [Oscillochloris sp.]|nr:hypothetical protein [Oscillochloris sp.]